MQQTASVHGQGNVLVQIVGDGNAVTIAGATALRLVSYLGPDYAEAPADPAMAGEAGYTATGRAAASVLYPYNRDSLPFQGREAPLAQLKAWLAADKPVLVQALVGGGGSGKTRLAVEVAAWARANGWTAGFAKQSSLDVFRAAGCRTEWSEPCLVVVDYAAAKTAELRLWLDALTQAQPAKPLRLLLLERTGRGSAWWRELFERPGAEGKAVARRLAQGAPLVMEPFDRPEERYAVFAAALSQASDAPPPAPSPALDQALLEASLGGEPLFLAMFGLTAARQGLAATKTLAADEIALELAEEELLRIGRIWEARGLRVLPERRLHAQLAAVATLCEGLSEADTHLVIARESAAINQESPPGQTEAARAALHAALPAEAGGGIAAIFPDILGEAVAICAFRELPDGGVEAVRRAAQVGRAAVTRTVIRACQDFLIRGQRAPLAWLQALQTDAVDLDALVELGDALPPATLELREIAVALSQEILRGALELGEDGLPLAATSLNNLSNRLAGLGQREEALAAIAEAVDIFRALAAARLDAFRPDLANSLNNLSVHLAALGRHKEALAAIAEAVELGRALAAARPDVFRPDLARSLNNLSNRLADLGRGEEALGAIAEAADLFRALAATRPAAFSPDLAGSLNNLSNRLADLSRSEEALAAIAEAVELRRALAAARPDAFRPDLADALNNLSLRLADLGRREAALGAIVEAVELCRALAASHPLAFADALATSLWVMAERVEEAGDAGGAMDANRAALLTLMPLFQRHPAALAGETAAMVRDYIERCERAQAEPDMDLLTPIVKLLAAETTETEE